jgi:hypothetical protein
MRCNSYGVFGLAGIPQEQHFINRMPKQASAYGNKLIFFYAFQCFPFIRIPFSQDAANLSLHY